MIELKGRVNRLAELLSLVQPVPPDWLAGARPHAGGKDLESLACRDWPTLIAAWRKAMRMRQGLEDVLAVMLAVCLSTEQVGDSQLFLMVIGVPGNAKTRLCDALLVSKKCCPLEHLKGFYSGYVDASGEDFSLLARINCKTLITPEMDVMMGDPNFIKLMSEARRIFDGTGGASYKNRKEDLRYTGLRTPWIAAGTPALLDGDQSRVGDRFLKVYVDKPDADEQRNILMRAGHTELRGVSITSNGRAEGQMTPELALAYRLTGGYVDHLRTNAAELLTQVRHDDDEVLERCAVLAEFTAILRARPSSDPRKQEGEVVVELPSRLMKQYVRLAKCLAAVLGRKSIDDEVLRLVRGVALDTSRGRTLDLVGFLHAAGEEGLSSAALRHRTHRTEEQDRRLLDFLRHPSVKAVRQVSAPVKPGLTPRTHWTLTAKMKQLYAEVVDG